MSIPGAANPLLLATAAAGGYQISRSLRFNSSDSAYLSRTPASAGNRKTWTYSFWFKLGKITGYQYFFSADYTGSSPSWMQMDNNSSKIAFIGYNGTSYDWLLGTDIEFRDPSAWQHFVIAFDTTQATASDRVKWYHNGVQLQPNRSGYTTYPALNFDSSYNTTTQHRISDPSWGLNSYLADVHFIDGQALTPSSFTEVSGTTGQLIPKAYTGTFTGNSFWLKFADNSAATATTLGKDSSGLGNNWTPNNLSVTAGAGNDSLVDTPTSYGTDTGAGGEVRGNYCTWNPLDSLSGNAFSNGNLDLVTSSSNYGTVRGTISVSSGKWYWEVTKTAGAAEVAIGIIKSSASLPSYVYATADGYSYNGNWNGNKGNAASTSSYGANYNDNDVIGVALDLDAGTLTFYKNGVSQGTAFTGLSGSFSPALSDVATSTTAAFVTNFGQRQWAYAAPAGFKALCDTNLPAPVVAKPSTVMDVKLYTGNGSTQTISGLGFSPDLVWGKGRSYAGSNALYDSVRGATKYLTSNGTGAEGTVQGVTAFNSDGFTLGNDSETNFNAGSLVAWCWDAGSSTVTNTQGSITSSVRANASAGFSIVTYTGNGTAGATVGHGLNVAPSLMIIKSRSGVTNWAVYHRSIGATKYLMINETASETTSITRWNDTAPTSSVFSVGDHVSVNTNTATYVAYCFSPVAGYSSFGSYVGNGSADGPFVFCGFRPRWLLIKRTDTSGDPWIIRDAARDPYNSTTSAKLAPNESYEENNASYIGAATATLADFVSNGFKVRSTGNISNASGGTYVWAAFAESPFAYSRAR